MKSLDFNVLPLFAAVARHRNFRRAAAELSLPASTLSERLRDFEEQLGVRLLNRTTRSVSVTEAGQRLLDEIGGPVAAIDAALAAVGTVDRDLRGVLRINGPKPAIDFRLTPLLLKYLARYPLMHVDVVVEAALIDIVADGYDAGVRYGESLDQDMVAISLGAPQRYVVAGSPGYLDAHGRPQSPEDLSRHRCFAQLFSRGNRRPWELQRDEEIVNFMPRGPLASSEIATQIAAAKAGLGLVATFEEYCAPDIASGALETVLDEWCPPFPGPFLYYPERRLMPAGLRALVDLIKAETRAQMALP
jgi:DNA-binding transcriptional LysR family regulator